MSEIRTGHPVQRLFRPVVQLLTRPKADVHPTKVLRRLSDEWAKRTLSTRFVIVATAVIFATMLHLGAWMDGRVRKGVIHAAATASARLMEHALRDHVQVLSERQTISADGVAALERLTGDTELGRTIFKIRIWLPDGTLAYASNGKDMGEKALLSAELLGALSGKLEAHFADDHDMIHLPKSLAGTPIFEVYAPVRARGTGQVIGVSEFYEDATGLMQQFTIERQQNWIVIGSLTLGMLSLLFGVVHRGSLLILDQKRSLEARLVETSRLLQQNEKLRDRIVKAQHQTHEHADRLLRRIGADLHDGPAQLLSLALLRLHELKPAVAAVGPAYANDDDDAALTIKAATQDALNEIRSISSGLSLPELQHLSTADTIRLAVNGHERRSKTKVELHIENVSGRAPLMIRTCAFRCVQEALSNAFRHADGADESVVASSDGQVLQLCIRDAGPGFEVEPCRMRDDALGIAGLRHRVESLGGTFAINSIIGRGTTVSISLPLETPIDG